MIDLEKIAYFVSGLDGWNIKKTVLVEKEYQHTETGLILEVPMRHIKYKLTKGLAVCYLECKERGVLRLKFLQVPFVEMRTIAQDLFRISGCLEVKPTDEMLQFGIYEAENVYEKTLHNEKMGLTLYLYRRVLLIDNACCAEFQWKCLLPCRNGVLHQPSDIKYDVDLLDYLPYANVQEFSLGTDFLGTVCETLGCATGVDVFCRIT